MDIEGLKAYFTTPQVGLIFFQTLIMICTLFFLKKFAWNTILAFIEEEEKNHAQAALTLKKTNTKIHKLEVASEGIITKTKERSEYIITNALASKKAFLEEGHQELTFEKEKMIKQGNQQIAAQLAKEKESLKKETASLVIKATEKLLRIPIEKKYTETLFLEQLIQDATNELGHKT